MTEAEAKTKWCFAAVASHTNPRSGFGGDTSLKVFPCIASDCMAWRWSKVPNWEWEAAPEPTDVPMEITSTTEGFCGLAGPQ